MEAAKLEIIVDPARPIITTRRMVAAPRALVFEVFSKPEHIKHWMGPRALEMVSCEMDLRPGGKWRFVHRAPDGQDFGFHGEFREIDAPARMVRTFIFEPWPDAEALETLLLEEKNGKTLITTTTVHNSMEARDAMLKGGMEAGMTEGYERLDALLVTMQAAR